MCGRAGRRGGAWAAEVSLNLYAAPAQRRFRSDAGVIEETDLVMRHQMRSAGPFRSTRGVFLAPAGTSFPQRTGL
jgi:hypothetical protein